MRSDSTQDRPRECAYCHKPIPAGLRADARHCSNSCRVMAHRARKEGAPGTSPRPRARALKIAVNQELKAVNYSLRSVTEGDDLDHETHNPNARNPMAFRLMDVREES
jgi:hypothetical protein